MREGEGGESGYPVKTCKCCRPVDATGLLDLPDLQVLSASRRYRPPRPADAPRILDEGTALGSAVGLEHDVDVQYVDVAIHSPHVVLQFLG